MKPATFETNATGPTMTPSSKESLDQEYRSLVLEMIRQNKEEVQEVRKMLGIIEGRMGDVNQTLAAHKTVLAMVGSVAGLFGGVVPYIIKALFAGLTNQPPQ